MTSASRAERLAEERQRHTSRPWIRWTVPVLGVLLGSGALATALTNSGAVGCSVGVGTQINTQIFEGSGSTPAPVTSPQVVRVGDTIAYTVDVFTNASTCAFTNGTVSITLPDASVHTLATGVSIAPGGLQTFNAAIILGSKYTVVDADLTKNGASADHIRALTSTVGDEQQTGDANAAAFRDLLVIHPETSLTKSASPTSGHAPLAVTFTFKESNISTEAGQSAADVKTWDQIAGSSIVITDSDSNCSAVTFVSSSDGDTVNLNPGATWTYTCTETFSTAGTFTDHATATGNTVFDGREAGTAASSGAPHDEASADVVVTVTNPPSTTLTETTSPSPADGRAPLAVTFTYVEKNTGPDPINNVVVTSSLCSPVSFVSSSDGVTTQLNPGESWTYTCTKTFTTAGTFTDNSSATGTDTVDQSAVPTTGESDHATVTVRAPSTTLTETASPTSGIAPLAVTFTYVEKNTGTDPVNNVVVTASLCSPVSFVSSSDGVTTQLNPGESWTFTCTKTFTTAGTFTDSSSATGVDVTDGLAEPTVGESSQATVIVSPPSVANLTPGFWKNHQNATQPLLNKSPGIFLGGYQVTTFADAQTILSGMGCGKVGPLNCMAGMLLAAELNLANGGSTCIVTNGVIGDANALLSFYSYSGFKSYSISSADAAKAMQLHDELSAYNIDGVPTC